MHKLFRCSSSQFSLLQLHISTLDMANSDTNSSTVRVLVSFYLAASDSTSGTTAIHKEKFNVPISGSKHKDLVNFVRHVKTFTGLLEIAKSKGLGENPEVTIARVQKAGSGIETFSLRTQDPWKHEFNTLIWGNRMLQGTSYYVLSFKIKNV